MHFITVVIHLRKIIIWWDRCLITIMNFFLRFFWNETHSLTQYSQNCWWNVRGIDVWSFSCCASCFRHGGDLAETFFYFIEILRKRYTWKKAIHSYITMSLDIAWNQYRWEDIQEFSFSWEQTSPYKSEWINSFKLAIFQNSTTPGTNQIVIPFSSFFFYFCVSSHRCSSSHENHPSTQFANVIFNLRLINLMK